VFSHSSILQYSVIFRYYIAQSLLVTTAHEATPSFCKMTDLGHGRRRTWVGGGLVAGVHGGDSCLSRGCAAESVTRGHGIELRARGAWYGRAGSVGPRLVSPGDGPTSPSP
jgi:hypothetical protein